MNINFSSDISKLKNSIPKALNDLGNQLDQEIKNAQVIPKDTGALENSQKIEVQDKTLIISYGVDYASRVYYHPEKQYKQDKNSNAKGKWLEEFLEPNKLLTKYAENLKKEKR